ncbi:MAG: agmatinase [Calditrichaeota bacterium]|nr:agmatinase [Calditrichota bacterium]
MRSDYLLPRIPFEGCQSSYADARLVIVGAGFDGTSSYRPGSRFAPQSIRAETLLSQENYSPYFQVDLTELAIHDAGDLDLPFGNKEEALRRIKETVQQIVSDGKIPCVIGGEHLVSLPVVQAVHRAYPDVHLLQLDAHLDLMDELFGDRLSHGTVMRRILETIGDGRRLFQVGVRSGSREEFQFARQHTQLYLFHTREFQKHVHLLEDRPVYLSLDVDVFDPALLPGTGTPEAGGIFFDEFIEFLKAIKHLNIVGCDLVELSPKLDPTGNSTITTAKILRELLITILID